MKKRIAAGYLLLCLLALSVQASVFAEALEQDPYETWIWEPSVEKDDSLSTGQAASWSCVTFGSYPQTEIVSEVFTDWFPCLKGVGFQATWCGYYTEPRYIVDPDAGLFVGMRGHGFMLSQYIAKLYVDYLNGRKVPDYFKEMALTGKGLSEQAFK